MDLLTYALGVWIIWDAIDSRGMLALGVLAGALTLPAGAVAPSVVALAWAGSVVCLTKILHAGISAGFSALLRALAVRPAPLAFTAKTTRDLAAIEAEQDRQLRLLDRRIELYENGPKAAEAWKDLPLHEPPDRATTIGRIGPRAEDMSGGAGDAPAEETPSMKSVTIPIPLATDAWRDSSGGLHESRAAAELANALIVLHDKLRAMAADMPRYGVTETDCYNWLKDQIAPMREIAAIQEEIDRRTRIVEADT